MMLRKVSAIFATAFILAALAAGSSAQSVEESREATSSFSSRNFRYEMRASDFANTPSWDPETGEPPISASSALRAARGKLGLYVESPEIWKVRAIDLIQFGNTDKWHYRIRFMCFGTPCKGFSDRSFVSIVKLDGTLIEPKRIIEVK